MPQTAEPSATRRAFIAAIALILIVTGVASGAPFALNPGDLLIADSGTYENNFVARILRVSPAGSVTVLASSANSILRAPASVYQDGDDALLIADMGATADQGAILRLSLATGAVTAVVSGPGLSGVSSMAFEPGSDFIVTDPLAFGGGTPGAVYRIGRAGTPRVLIANGASGGPYPFRILHEPAGTYLVLGQNGYAIRRLDLATGTAPAWVIDTRLNGLRDMKRTPDGTVYTVSGDLPSRLAKITPDGTVTILSEGGILQHPFSLVVLPGGDVLAANYRDGSVVRINGTSGAQTSFLPPHSVFQPEGMTLVEMSAVPATPATWGGIKATYR
jgi:DNA-binding beta-propeller fold protein YncE